MGRAGDRQTALVDQSVLPSLRVELSTSVTARTRLVAGAFALVAPGLFIGFGPYVHGLQWLWLASAVVALLFSTAGYRLIVIGWAVGWWFVGCGIIWALFDATALDGRPGQAASAVLRVLLWVALGWGCLSYPRARPALDLGPRPVLAVVAAAVLLVATFSAVLVYAPGWPAGRVVVAVLSPALAIAGAVCFRRRLRALGPHERQYIIPVAWLVAAAAAVAWPELVFWPRIDVAMRSFWWQVTVAVATVLLGLVPAGVVVAAFRRRVARAKVVDLLAELARPPTIDGVQAVLRAALHDPSATVLCRLPDTGGYIAADTTVVPAEALPARLADRLAVAALGDEGDAVALVHMDPSLRRHLELVEVALVACGPALENARLQVATRVQVEAIKASRARIVDAAIAERQRLERDIHDGAQQRLLAVFARLEAARVRSSSPQVSSAIEVARDQLQTALQGLRRLSRDLYSPALFADGLSSALESIADEAELSVRTHVTDQRLDAPVETIAYLTAHELLGGLSRLCGATSATVTATVAGGRLELTVAHDATIAPDPASDTWIMVISDRLHAFSGDLTALADKYPGTGEPSVIEVVIPCE
jgi:signal transduction histidine kinase